MNFAALDLSLIQQGRIVFIIWRNAPGWPIEQVSDSISSLIGYSATQLIESAMPYSDLLLADDLLRVEAEVQQAIAAGQNEFSHHTYRLKHQNGSIRYIYDHTRVLRNEAGKITHFAGYLFDESPIYTQHQRLQLVLEGTGLGMWDWNPQTNEVTFDAGWANMLGYQLHEIEPSLEAWSSRVHPDDLNSCYDDIQRHMQGETPAYRNIHRMQHKDGHWLYIWDRGKIVEWDATGKPIRFTGTHTDISAQKNVENQLIEESRAKENFFALMSHELRTPMNAILGFTELMTEAQNLTTEQHQHLGIISAQSRSLLTILNDILDYSKINSGNIVFEQRAFDLRHLCETTQQFFQPQLLEKNSTIELHFDHSIDAPVIGDEVRVAQILKNYLSNAIKFSSQDTIELHLKQIDHKTLEFKVIDHGLGISPENQQKLFTPFMQAEDSINRNFGGTGLGLCLSKLLAQGMGGEVFLHSEAGQGSTFGFTLPFKTSSAKRVDESSATKTLDWPRIKVLLVEDNPVNQKLGQVHLRKIGVQTALANNGKEAIEACRQQRFDLILMDVQMPVMNGLDAAAHLRQNPEFNTPIIALTANASASSRSECLNAGMQDFLSKPYNREQLENLLVTWARVQ